MKTAEGSSLEISVLVPVVERHDDLRELHRAVVPELEKLGRTYEFLYLLSGEFDEALRQALELHERDANRVRVLRFARPVSEAAALATGFERARGQVIFTLPAYFDADPKGLGGLYAAIDSGVDLAVAVRTERSDGLLKRLQTKGFNRLTSWATGTEFSDIASGTRALRREVVAEMPLYGDFHRFLPVLVHRAGFAVREVPTPQDARARAPRVYRVRTYLWRMLDILSIFFLSYFTRRPLRLFGAVGTLFGGIGGLILLVVGIQRIAGESAAGRPILILGTLLVGLGVQAFTVGLLGELLLFFQARNVSSYRIAEIYESDEPPLPERE
jgi:glycosyltransferase involved in cell wall biosynthesis